MRITRNRNVISLYLEDSATADYRRKLLLMSDIHYDSKYCDRKLLKRDLDRAITDDGYVFIAGDFFDAMQGKKDMRGSYDELRPEYRTDKYFDVIVDDAYEFLKPYQKQLIMFGYGNHETSVIRHQQTDLLSRLTGALNSGQDHKVQTGGYGGWVRLMFHSGKTPRGSLTYWYHHGKGASAIVTDGIMDDKRTAAVIPDADICHYGHNHKEYVHTVARVRLSGKGLPERADQLHVRTPGYKSAHLQDDDGLSWDFAQLAPAPVGSVWVTIGTAAGRPKVLEYTKIY